MAGMVLVAASGAFAQAPEPSTEKFFVNVNFGGQLADRALGVTVSKTIYEETATLTSTQDVNKGFLFDFGGGYADLGRHLRGRRRLPFRRRRKRQLHGVDPRPDFLQPAEDGHRHRERLEAHRMVHEPACALGVRRSLTRWTFRLPSASQSSISRQDLLSDFDVPAGTQTPNIVLVNESGTGVGPYAAVDFIYNLSGALRRRWFRAIRWRESGSAVELRRERRRHAGRRRYSAALLALTEPAIFYRRLSGWKVGPLLVRGAGLFYCAVPESRAPGVRATECRRCRPGCPDRCSVRSRSASARRPNRPGCPTAAGTCPVPCR